MSLVPALTQIVAGDADDPSRDMSNWNAIRNVVNGSLDTTNLSATAAITAAQTTIGTFTDWTSWTPGFGGFSANPTVTWARYMQIGKLAIVTYKQTANGTSNATTFTITGLPLTPSFPSVTNLLFPAHVVTDGGTLQAAAGRVDVTSGSTTLTLRLDSGGATNWTNSSIKGVDNFTVMYQVA